MMPFIETTTDLAKIAMLKDTIIDMLKLVEDASLFIIEYKSDGAAGKNIWIFHALILISFLTKFVQRVLLYHQARKVRLASFSASLPG